MSFPAENLPVAPSHYTYSKNPRPLSQPPGLRPLSRDPICAVRVPSSDVPSWIPWRSITPGRFPSSSHGGGGGSSFKRPFPSNFCMSFPLISSEIYHQTETLAATGHPSLIICLTHPMKLTSPFISVFPGHRAGAWQTLVNER